MFIMVAHIEGNPIEWAIIGVCLKSLGKHIVLRYEVPCNRMQSHGQYRTDQQVRHRFPAEEVNDYRIEGQLNDRIDQFQASWWLRVHYQWTENIEEGLQTHPQELAERRVE